VNLAIIGCGALGSRRAEQLRAPESMRMRLVHCVDADLGRAQAAARPHESCSADGDWRTALARRDVEAVIIATPHDALAGIARAAIEAGKHVLVEKPAARRACELRELPALASQRGVCVRVGFNHRHHRAFRQARTLVDSGALGPLMFVRARYGHGGRPGYEREWRARPDRAGGGELIDQGVHLIDLSRWFLGEFTEIGGSIHTYYWDMPVEDNAFLLLKTGAQQAAFLHASCTEWKNTFCFELYGRAGKLQIDGLGGSYGTERLTWYRMRPEMGPPDTTVWEYPMADDSWSVELDGFCADIEGRRDSSPGLHDAIAALEIVERVYAAAAGPVPREQTATAT
jgi:predicted dehydrogenase